MLKAAWGLISILFTTFKLIQKYDALYCRYMTGIIDVHDAHQKHERTSLKEAGPVHAEAKTGTCYNHHPEKPLMQSKYTFHSPSVTNVT